MASARRRAGAMTVAATACAGLLAYYIHEHPERFSESQTEPENKMANEKTSTKRNTLRDALDRAGFFTSFGFVAASAVVFELAAGNGVSRDWKWRMLIGYVAGNHALYAAHCLVGSGRLHETGADRSGTFHEEASALAKDAGVGEMLQASSRSAIRAAFDEHRLADVLVHAGAVVAGGVSVRRLDSLASLCEHLRRYANLRDEAPRRATEPPTAKFTAKNAPARTSDAAANAAASSWWNDALVFWVAAAERKVFVTARTGRSRTGRSSAGSAGNGERVHIETPPRSLSVADVVDVVAHCRTACKVLTVRELAFSLVFAETARRALRLDLIKHHRE